MSIYIAETVEDQDSPHSEILIEFTPRFPNYDFAYSSPDFVFAQFVLLRAELAICQSNNLDWKEECEVYRICALELVEPARIGSKKLADFPYWMYGIRGTKGTSELVWFSEFELISRQKAQNLVDEF
ncbi:MAG TPA: hypothetical protein DCF68_16665 [Cyanothece sp. UBA12306]|nr:hypothetical protein [Cyanothece sp. UBA12306]